MLCVSVCVVSGPYLVGRRRLKAPLNYFHPPGKMCWMQFKPIGHSLKNLGPSQKTFHLPWYPKLVTGLCCVLTVLWTVRFPVVWEW